MKNIRQLYAAFVLMFVLSTFAFAGQMSTPITPPPPPPSAADGQMSTPVAGQMTTWSSEVAVDPVTQVALNLLQSVMSLF